MSKHRGAVWVAFSAAMMLMASPASAQVDLWETDQTHGELRANAQMTTALVDVGELEDIVNTPRRSGLGSAVGRLVWFADLGRYVDVEIHNRLVWSSSTLPDQLLAQGVGVSAGDDRRLNTDYDLIDEPTATLTHDLDRAVVGVYLDWFDLYLGRQAIRWGTSELFRVVDRFAPLSPFELDTLQPRGVDAARAITHFTPNLELDLVVADRGEEEPVSMAGRLEYFGRSFDAHGGLGRFWERISAMGGLSWLFGHWKLFGEGELLWNLDDGQLDRPRATIGLQRMAMNWQIGAEVHYNGFGIAPGDNYVEALIAPELQRGETYFSGRYYAGVNGMYSFDNGVGVGGGAIANVADPSAVVYPLVQYELEQAFSVAAGGYVGFGDEPTLELDPDAPFMGLEFPSEFGAVSDLYYVQMTAFF